MNRIKNIKESTIETRIVRVIKLIGQERSIRNKLGLLEEQQKDMCLDQVNEVIDGTNENEGVCI